LENLMAEIHGISNSRADMREIFARLDKQAGKEVSGVAVFWEGENGVEFETAGEMTLSALVGAQCAVLGACLETLLAELEGSEDD
jgi:fructose-bisphosphate aldolase class 1